MWSPFEINAAALFSFLTNTVMLMAAMPLLNIDLTMALPKLPVAPVTKS